MFELRGFFSPLILQGTSNFQMCPYMHRVKSQVQFNPMKKTSHYIYWTEKCYNLKGFLTLMNFCCLFNLNNFFLSWFINIQRIALIFYLTYVSSYVSLTICKLNYLRRSKQLCSHGGAVTFLGLGAEELASSCSQAQSVSGIQPTALQSYGEIALSGPKECILFLF